MTNTQLIITVEFTVGSPSVSDSDGESIAAHVHGFLSQPSDLGQYLWTLGSFDDTIVTQVKITSESVLNIGE